MDLLDGYVHIAKVRVASSNLVIRSRETPGERPFRGPLVAGVVVRYGSQRYAAVLWAVTNITGLRLYVELGHGLPSRSGVAVQGAAARGSLRRPGRKSANSGDHSSPAASRRSIALLLVIQRMDHPQNGGSVRCSNHPISIAEVSEVRHYEEQLLKCRDPNVIAGRDDGHRPAPFETRYSSEREGR
jgi:hypothetical protein